MYSRWLQHDPLQPPGVGVLDRLRDRRQLGRRDVGGDGVLHRIEKAGQREHQVARRELRTQRGQQLLLPIGAGEVAVPGAHPRARVGERDVAVHVMPARLDEEPGMGAELIDVGRILDGPLNLHVDAAHGVDRLLEAEQVDGGEIVDLDTQQLADGGLQGADPAERVGRRVRGGGRHERVQLLVERRVIRQRDAVQVARNGDHGRSPRAGIEADHEHRVGQGGGPAGCRVHPHEQDVDPLAEAEVRLVARLGEGEKPGSPPPLRDGLPPSDTAFSVSIAFVAYQAGTTCIPSVMTTSAPGRVGRPPSRAKALPPVVRLEDGDQPPPEQGHVEDDQGDENPDVEHRGEELGSPRQGRARPKTSDERQDRAHERCSQQSLPVVGLAEAGQNEGEQCREAGAPIGRSGAGGMVMGSGGLGGCGRADRPAERRRV